jgi:hypothetical protein
MWDGYFALDGQEVINAARTEAYAADQTWFRPVFDNDNLAGLLDHAEYTFPLDEAPWYDPDVPESADFFGYYPLEVTGLDDSSRTSQVTESTLHGGAPGRLRFATRPVVFNGILVGANEKAVAYGAMWLRRVLLGDLCGNPGLDHTLGTDLSFLSSAPDEFDTYEDLYRKVRRFSVNAGPTVTSKRTIQSCGGAVWMVTFTGVAGDPYVYGATKSVINGYLGLGQTGYNRALNGSFENNLDGWAATGGPTISRVVGPAKSGNSYMRVESTATTAGGRAETTTAGKVPVTEGEEVTLSGYVKREVGTRQVRTVLMFEDDAGTLLSTVLGTNVVPADDWSVRAHVTAIAPTGTTKVRLRLQNGTTGAIGDRVQWDAIMLHSGSTLLDYFDGSTPDTESATYSWEGPAHASPSTRVEQVTDPWAPGVVAGTVDGDPTAFTEVVCGEDTWEPIYDPLCPPLVAPPAPPSLPLGCLVIPEAWSRYKVVLPAENVPLWGSVAPVINLHTVNEMRNVRLRFYDDPTETVDPDDTPCAYDVDMVVSYMPAGATLTIDMGAEEVWVETAAGQRRRADSLVFGTDSRPFIWKTLSCGSQQIITLDTEVGVDPPVVDLALVPRVV